VSERTSQETERISQETGNDMAKGSSRWSRNNKDETAEVSAGADSTVPPVPTWHDVGSPGAAASTDPFTAVTPVTPAPLAPPGSAAASGYVPPAPTAPAPPSSQALPAEPVASVSRLEMKEVEMSEVEATLFEVKKVIVGQTRMLERMMICLLAGGHCLLEGVPGIAKTLAVESLANAVGGKFVRVQFTPDLLPADIVGTRIWRASTETFDIELGPILANFVLADEINRAPAKVQSALLEAMAEKQVSVGGQTFPMPDPFLVLATQNPIESEGVYPLPEAQRDRFLMKILVGYPNPNEEVEIVQRMGVSAPEASQVLDIERLAAMQQEVKQVFVDRNVMEYAVSLTLATRDPASFGLDDLTTIVSYGASPRASLGLVAAGRAMAYMRGRSYALPQDIFDVAPEILRHRIVLSYEALAREVTADNVAATILSTVPAPRVTARQDPSSAAG